MYEVSKQDWKLFNSKIGDWQETYMDHLTKEYISLLSCCEPASDRFWELEKRIDADKQRPGVRLVPEKSEMFFDIAALLKDEAISLNDLKDFSRSLNVEIRSYLGLPPLTTPEEFSGSVTCGYKITNGEIAWIINEQEEAIKLFEKLSSFGLKIPYQIIGRGENKGKIKVLRLREKDSSFYLQVEQFLKSRRRGIYLDHISHFRTDDGRTVITMNPYIELSDLSRDITKDGTPHTLGGYEIYVSRHSIYGNDTPTICIWEKL